jgi:uncharacterized protein (DUF305 family)
MSAYHPQGVEMAENARNRAESEEIGILANGFGPERYPRSAP